MPSLHFTSPYGHVKPPLLHALSLKRKKSHVAAAAAAAVFKAFTNPRGKNVLLRQGVKYRNMFHSGGGLVRERQPGEEVTPERGWVTDEESEQSETEEIISVSVETESLVEMSEPEEETVEEPEVLVMAVEESAIDVIQEQEEVAKTDLLKLELSLAEKEIPQVAVPEEAVIEVNEEVVEAPVVPVQDQEPTPDSSNLEVVEQKAPVEMSLDEVEEQIPEQLMVEVVEPVEEQESVTEAGACLAEEAADIVLPAPEPKPELILEPSHREPLSLTSVMNILEPSESGPLSLTAMMNILEYSKPVPVPLTAAMEVVEAPKPEPLTPMAVIEVPEVPALHSVQQPESITEVKDTEIMEAEEISKVVEEEQEEMKAELEQHEEATICEAILEVEEAQTLSSEESNVEDEAVSISLTSDQIIEKESEAEEIVPEAQLILSPSIAVPTLEVQSEELKEEIVEMVLPIRVPVIPPQPPQETPVLAISEKHSEQLFDDEVCEYDETELNEDEEPEVEIQLENQELEGLLESTPSHMFKLTLPIPSSTNNPTSSTVALCVKPEQTLLDLQKLIQLELPHASTGSQHISFTTLGIEPPDRTTDIVPRADSTGFSIKDGEHTILRKSSYSDPSKYSSKPTCTPTRWSLSTEIGAFIGDAAKSQCFTIGISVAPDKSPATNIRISLPSFNDRTLHLRSQLRILAPNLSSLSALKSECDAAAQRTAQKRSILTLAMSGFACLLLPILLITFAYLSQPGLLPSFRNPPPWDLKVTHPVTTYIAAGLADIFLLAGFAYVWSAYRMTGRHNAPDIATVKKVYSERGLDVAKWEELQKESARLRSEIRRVAAEYGVSWDDDEVEETKETGTAATAA